MPVHNMSFWKLIAILFADIDIAKQVHAVHALAKCGKTPLPRDKLFALGTNLAPCMRLAPNLVRIPGSCRSSLTAPGRYRNSIAEAAIDGFRCIAEVHPAPLQIFNLNVGFG